MTCNLLNNEKELKNAFNSVSNSATGEQWCIFEYDGNSNIVRLGSTGDNGGLEELVEQLNSGKIQYGFATTTATNSSQRKIILIHWGEGVPAARLANTAAHAEEIRRFVRLVHLTIYARNEEDVGADVIAKQLASKLSAEFTAPQLSSNSNSACSSNRSSVSTPWVPPTPVGSDYCPTKPTKDINMDERAKFWNEMRAEEEARRREEVQRKDEQQKAFAAERRQLESKLHESHLSAAAAKSSTNGHLTKALSVDSSSSKKGKLIAGRTQLFEQKVAEIAKSIPKPMTKPKNFKFQVGVVRPADQVPVNRQQEGTPQVVECSFDRRPGKLNGGGNAFPTAPKYTPVAPALAQPPPPQPAQIPVLPVQPIARKDPAVEEPQEFVKQEKMASQLYDQPPGNQPEQIIAQAQPQKQNGGSESVVGGGGHTIRAKALWDYQAEDDTEISFDPEDILTDVEKLHDGWWRGRSPRGQVGLFPSNYVELL